MSDNLELIRDVVTLADEAHTNAVRSADEARHATYRSVIRTCGIDREEEFIGAPDLALLHFRGTDGFDRRHFTALSIMIDQIGKAAKDADSRIPILAITPHGPADLDTPPHHERTATTSLSIIYGMPLIMKSTVDKIPDVVVNTVTGDTTTVEERSLAIEAETSTLPVLICDKDESEFKPRDVIRSDGLTVYTSQDMLDRTAGRQPVDERGFSGGIAGKALESDANIIVGWSDIHHYLSRMASAFAFGGCSVDENWIPPASSPNYQAAVLETLTGQLDLLYDERAQLNQIQEMLSGYAERAASV